MGKKSPPRPPAPPDPGETAEEQYKWGKKAAYDTAMLNQMGITTPWGSVSYTGEIGDPNRQAIATLSPELQALFTQGISGMGGLLENPYSFTPGTTGGQFSPYTPTNVGTGGRYQQFTPRDATTGGQFRDITTGGRFRDATTGGQFGPITTGGAFGQFNPRDVTTGDAFREFNWNEAPVQRQNADEVGRAFFDRSTLFLNPELQRQEAALEQDLYNRGLDIGTQAYAGARNRFDDARSRQLTDISLASVLASQDEVARRFDQDLGAQRDRFGFAIGEHGINLQGYESAQGRQLTAGLANQQAALDAARLNQQGYEAAQGRGLTAQGMNLQAYEQAQGRGLTVQDMNQRAYEDAQRRGLTAQDMNLRAYEQAQGRGLTAQGMNQQAQMDAYRANLQAFEAEQMRRMQADTLNQQAGMQAHGMNFGAYEAAQNRAMQQQMFNAQMGLTGRQQQQSELAQALGYAGLLPGASGPGGGVQAPNYMGLVGQNYQGAMNAYGQQMAAHNQMWGGLLGGLGNLGAAAIFASDRRLKDNIHPIEKMDNGLTRYSFNYIWDDETEHTGYMADEVRDLYPEAVIEIDGYDHVDYSMIPEGV